MGTLRTWERRHGQDIVGQVTPVMGIGSWDVTVCREPNSRDLHTGGRFGLLTDAHHAADALVWSVFKHICDSTCSRWTPVERRQPAREQRQAETEAPPVDRRRNQRRDAKG